MKSITLCQFLTWRRNREEAQVSSSNTAMIDSKQPRFGKRALRGESAPLLPSICPSTPLLAPRAWPERRKTHAKLAELAAEAQEGRPSCTCVSLTCSKVGSKRPSGPPLHCGGVSLAHGGCPHRPDPARAAGRSPHSESESVRYPLLTLSCLPSLPSASSPEAKLC